MDGEEQPRAPLQLQPVQLCRARPTGRPTEGLADGFVMFWVQRSTFLPTLGLRCAVVFAVFAGKATSAENRRHKIIENRGKS